MTKNLPLHKMHYQSILNILKIYQYQKDKSSKLKKRGLTPNQLLFATSAIERKRLQKSRHKFEKLENFFKQFEEINQQLSLNYMYKNKLIYPDCIGSANHLIQYMNRLCKKKLVKKHGKRPNVRYTLNEDEYDEKNLKEIIKNSINQWHFPYLNQTSTNTCLHSNLGYPLDMESNREKIKTFSYDYWVLYGLPAFVINDLSKQEKKELDTWLLNIEENLSNILQLKISKLKNNKKYIKYLKKGGFPIEHLMFYDIGFFYKNERSIPTKLYQKEFDWIKKNKK